MVLLNMIDRFVVGGFCRVHTGRGKDEHPRPPATRLVVSIETGDRERHAQAETVAA